MLAPARLKMLPAANIPDTSQNHPQSRRIVTFPFRVALDGRSWPKIGGLESWLSAEMDAARRALADLLLICEGPSNPTPFDPDDPVRLAYPRQTIEPRASDALLEFWFDEMWAYLHPDAFTSAGLSLSASPMDSSDRFGSGSASVREFYEHNSVLGQWPNLLEEHAARYDALLGDVPARSDLFWCDFFFASCLCRRARRLRASGVTQTYISHSYHPEDLDQSERGRWLIRAISEVDVVCFHTDQFVSAFQNQVERQGCRMPLVRRFDLGVDRGALIAGLSSPTPTSGASGFVREVLATRFNLAHRFICLDRLDPAKGLHVVLQAAERHLDTLTADLETLRRQYRFFFLMHYYRTGRRGVNPDSPSNRYIDYVRNDLIPRLCRKYPGIFYFTDNVPSRQLVPALLVDAHVLSGGMQEGLGLAVQEGLFVNARAGTGRTAIVGDGSGFAMQTIAQGCGALAEFPRRGSVSDFAASIGRVVSSDPDHLRLRTRELSARAVETRAASLLAAVAK